MNLKNLLFPALVVVALAGAARAQSCSDLTITVGTDVVTVDLTGATPEATTFVLVSETQGLTTISAGLVTVTVDLGLPLVPVPVGETDGNGELHVDVAVPGAGTLGLALFGQAVSATVTFPPPVVTTCVSDVEAFTI